MAESSSGRGFDGMSGRRIDDGTMKNPMEAEVALDERGGAGNVAHLEVLIVFRENLSLRRRSKRHLREKRTE